MTYNVFGGTLILAQSINSGRMTHFLQNYREGLCQFSVCSLIKCEWICDPKDAAYTWLEITALTESL